MLTGQDARFSRKRLTKSAPTPPSCPHMGTGDWIPRAAFSHLKGELPKDFRLCPISILGGQCFQTARVMLFPHIVWVREAATLCRSQMYPQHKEQGTEPWKLNLLVVEGRRQMLLLPCWLWFASSMQNGILPDPCVASPSHLPGLSTDVPSPDTNPVPLSSRTPSLRRH